MKRTIITMAFAAGMLLSALGSYASEENLAFTQNEEVYTDLRVIDLDKSELQQFNESYDKARLHWTEQGEAGYSSLKDDADYRKMLSMSAANSAVIYIAIQKLMQEDEFSTYVVGDIGTLDYYHIFREVFGESSTEIIYGSLDNAAKLAKAIIDSDTDVFTLQEQQDVEDVVNMIVPSVRSEFDESFEKAKQSWYEEYKGDYGMLSKDTEYLNIVNLFGKNESVVYLIIQKFMQDDWFAMLPLAEISSLSYSEILNTIFKDLYPYSSYRELVSQSYSGAVKLVKAIIADVRITGIDEVSSSSASVSPKVYSADGKELDGLTKGLNIVKSADGKTVKVIR